MIISTLSDMKRECPQSVLNEYTEEILGAFDSQIAHIDAAIQEADQADKQKRIAEATSRTRVSNIDIRAAIRKGAGLPPLTEEQQAELAKGSASAWSPPPPSTEGQPTEAQRKQVRDGIKRVTG